MSAPRILVDSGADEHVCPKSFASAPPLGLVKGGTLYDAQGHMIEAHGTRTVHMRLGPEGHKNSHWLDATAYTMAEGARNADARLVAPVVDGLSEELLSRSSPTTPSFETARAPRGSSAKYLDSSSPVEDMRKRLRELRTPVWGTKTQMWRRVLEREVIERRHLDEEALLDSRRLDLESTIDPSVPKTLKGPTYRQNLNAQLTKSRVTSTTV